MICSSQDVERVANDVMVIVFKNNLKHFISTKKSQPYAFLYYLFVFSRSLQYVNCMNIQAFVLEYLEYASVRFPELLLKQNFKSKARSVLQ